MRLHIYNSLPMMNFRWLLSTFVSHVFLILRHATARDGLVLKVGPDVTVYFCHQISQ